MPDEVADDCADLLDAASSSVAFWDNPQDEAEWNDLPPEDEAPGDQQ